MTHIHRSQKLLHNKQCMCQSVFMILDPGVFAPLVWTFVPDVVPQLPQDVATEFSIHHLSWWNKFLMHDALNIALWPQFRSKVFTIN
jgi:hypothetical protein